MKNRYLNVLVAIILSVFFFAEPGAGVVLLCYVLFLLNKSFKENGFKMIKKNIVPYILLTFTFIFLSLQIYRIVINLN